MEKRLLELLDKVFSPDGEIIDTENRKLHKELISIATSVYSKSDMNFGNAETGEMNVANLLFVRKQFQNLKSLFDKVYTFDGETRACGRAKCIELIETATKMYPGTYFGDLKTGKMNFWRLLELRDSIFIEYQDS